MFYFCVIEYPNKIVKYIPLKKYKSRFDKGYWITEYKIIKDSYLFGSIKVIKTVLLVNNTTGKVTIDSSYKDHIYILKDDEYIRIPTGYNTIDPKDGPDAYKV